MDTRTEVSRMMGLDSVGVRQKMLCIIVFILLVVSAFFLEIPLCMGFYLGACSTIESFGGRQGVSRV
jgi:hypothetical protein